MMAGLGYSFDFTGSCVGRIGEDGSGLLWIDYRLLRVVAFSNVMNVECKTKTEAIEKQAELPLIA